VLRAHFLFPLSFLVLEGKSRPPPCYRGVTGFERPSVLDEKSIHFSALLNLPSLEFRLVFKRRACVLSATASNLLHNRLMSDFDFFLEDRPSGFQLL